MIPTVERINKSENESFVVGSYRSKWFERTWHYHPEYELLLITEGSGTRVIGDNSSRFKAGDLVLIGGNIPHAWFSDPEYFKEGSQKFCASVYLQFNINDFGKFLKDIPEFQPINVLLEEAKFGLQFLESLEHPIYMKLKELNNHSGLKRLLLFFEILFLFKKGNYKKIVSDDYMSKWCFTRSERIKRVHEYVMNNYMNEIKLEKVAQIAGMSTTSFCRFFKTMTGKTFSNYLKEIRIDFAQQLLINTDLPSNIVGFESGFSSVAYFNQCFKSICKLTPLEYRAAFKKV